MNLPLGATEEAFEKCKYVVGNVFGNVEDLDGLTVKIMNISYAKGGGYSGDIIEAFAKAYKEKGCTL